MVSLEYEYKKGVMFLRIAGKVNKMGIKEIKKSLNRVVEIGGIKIVVIDLDKCLGFTNNYFNYLISM